MAMVRKQIYIEQRQDEKVKRLAGQLGVTEAEVIRRAVESLQEADGSARTERAEAAARLIDLIKKTGMQGAEMSDLPWSRADIYQGYPRRLDSAAWEEELASIKERARSLPAGESARTWSREDAYDGKRFRVPG